METDWRLQGQEKYLSGVKLVKIRYRPSGDNDHDHCAFCWKKFSEAEEDLHVGYATLDGYHVICETCYEDFHDTFHWTVEQPD